MSFLLSASRLMTAAEVREECQKILQCEVLLLAMEMQIKSVYLKQKSSN